METALIIGEFLMAICWFFARISEHHIQTRIIEMEMEELYWRHRKEIEREQAMERAEPRIFVRREMWTNTDVPNDIEDAIRKFRRERAKYRFTHF